MIQEKTSTELETGKEIIKYISAVTKSSIEDFFKDNKNKERFEFNVIVDTETEFEVLVKEKSTKLQFSVMKADLQPKNLLPGEYTISYGRPDEGACGSINSIEEMMNSGKIKQDTEMFIISAIAEFED